MKSYPKLLSLTCALAFAATALGQRTPPTPAQMAQHEVQRYTAMLTLTSDQQTKALAIFTAEATSSQALHATEHTLHTTLETAVTADDLATIAATASSLGQLNGEMTAYRATAEAGLYALLNADQKTRYAAIKSAGGPMGHGGPGGPGGPGGMAPQ